MSGRNYQKELDQIIYELKEQGEVPKLLLHSCCAPCSSYVLEYLSLFFQIGLYFYNPNIFPEEEYRQRAGEQERLLREMPFANPVQMVPVNYAPTEFCLAVKGLEGEPEGGKRCLSCYELRLRAAAKAAAEGGFAYAATTLTISPLKKAQVLNEVGEKVAKEYGVCWLPGDFKKREGYKRSVELSGEYGLYRQDYCGCLYSRKERVYY